YTYKIKKKKKKLRLFYDTTKLDNDNDDEKKDKRKLIGANETECALLQWVIDAGAVNFEEIRKEYPVIKTFPFNGSFRASGILVKGKQEEEYLLFMKGAPEDVLQSCTHY
ncbi:calcium-transporting ATPase/ calmodulin binding protein, partial [Reticulomyxa filosa]